jgi:hypothetical protein
MSFVRELIDDCDVELVSIHFLPPNKQIRQEEAKKQAEQLKQCAAKLEEKLKRQQELKTADKLKGTEVKEEIAQKQADENNKSTLVSKEEVERLTRKESEELTEQLGKEEGERLLEFKQLEHNINSPQKNVLTHDNIIDNIVMHKHTNTKESNFIESEIKEDTNSLSTNKEMGLIGVVEENA